MYVYAFLGGDLKIVEYFQVSDYPVNEEELEYCVLVDAVHEDWIGRKRWVAETQTWVDVSPTESTMARNSLEFTHIDADGIKHWLDEFVNDLAEDVANAGSIDTSAFAPVNHNHSASNITSGTLAVGRGGTGSTSAKKNITLNRGSNTGTGSSAFGYDCEYIPYLNMCFVRVYAQPKETWSADAEYEVATIGNSTYYPANMVALSNYAQKEVSAYVNTEGQIVVRPYESVGTSYGIRLAGFWFCE